MLEQAPTREELTDALSADITAKGLDPAYAAEMARELAMEFASFEVPPAAPGTLGFLVGHYAIRKDDFKIFDAVTDGLKAAAGVSFFTAHQPILGANVAIGVSLTKLVRSLAMRGAFLDPDALHVLTILRCNAPTAQDSGLLPADILAIVQRTKPEADLAWVQLRLDTLKEMATRDGASTKLASADSPGRWRAHA